MTEPTTKSRNALPVALLGIVPFLILAAWHWPYGPLAQFGDWAQYVLHADALRHGTPYGDIGYIFTSRNPWIGPPVQPPGLPAVLVPLLAITHGAPEAVAYKLFMVACVAAFLIAVAIYFVRHGSRTLALATVLVTGLWLESGFATNAVQADAGFCALLWGVFCLADRPGDWTWSRVAAITTLGLAALAFRLAAIPLVPAVALWALLKRRELGLRPLVPVVVWCVCGVVAATLVPNALTVARLVPSILMTSIVTAAKIYPFAVLELFLYPLPWNGANDVYHLVIAVLAVVGAFVWVPRMRSRLSIVFAAGYVGMLVVVPVRDGRYLMPLAPLAIYVAVVGLSTAAAAVARLTRRELPPPRARRVSLAVVVAIVAAALGRELMRPKPIVLMDAPGVRSLFARLRAAQDTSSVRAVFVNPRVLTWRTGVPAMGFFLASPDTTLAEFRLRGITHVVVGDLDTDPLGARSIEAAVANRPNAFRRLYTEGVFTVYAFDSTRVPVP